jgi:hypothetical protein
MRVEGSDGNRLRTRDGAVEQSEKRLGPADIARKKHRAITLQLTSRTFSAIFRNNQFSQQLSALS